MSKKIKESETGFLDLPYDCVKIILKQLTSVDDFLAVARTSSTLFNFIFWKTNVPCFFEGVVKINSEEYLKFVKNVGSGYNKAVKYYGGWKWMKRVVVGSIKDFKSRITMDFVKKSMGFLLKIKDIEIDFENFDGNFDLSLGKFKKFSLGPTYSTTITPPNNDCKLKELMCNGSMLEGDWMGQDKLERVALHGLLENTLPDNRKNFIELTHGVPSNFGLNSDIISIDSFKVIECEQPTNEIVITARKLSIVIRIGSKYRDDFIGICSQLRAVNLEFFHIDTFEPYVLSRMVSQLSCKSLKTISVKTSEFYFSDPTFKIPCYGVNNLMLEVDNFNDVYDEMSLPNLKRIIFVNRAPVVNEESTFDGKIDVVEYLKSFDYGESEWVRFEKILDFLDNPKNVLLNKFDSSIISRAKSSKSVLTITGVLFVPKKYLKLKNLKFIKDGADYRNRIEKTDRKWCKIYNIIYDDNHRTFGKEISGNHDLYFCFVDSELYGDSKPLRLKGVVCNVIYPNKSRHIILKDCSITRFSLIRRSVVLVNSTISGYVSDNSIYRIYTERMKGMGYLKIYIAKGEYIITKKIVRGKNKNSKKTIKLIKVKETHKQLYEDIKKNILSMIRRGSDFDFESYFNKLVKIQKIKKQKKKVVV